MVTKAVLGLIPAMQSLALVSENIKTAKIPKKDGSGKGIRANKGRAGCSETELIGLGMKNIVGTSMIKITAGLV